MRWLWALLLVLAAASPATAQPGVGDLPGLEPEGDGENETGSPPETGPEPSPDNGTGAPDGSGTNETAQGEGKPGAGGPSGDDPPVSDPGTDDPRVDGPGPESGPEPDAGGGSGLRPDDARTSNATSNTTGAGSRTERGNATSASAEDPASAPANATADEPETAEDLPVFTASVGLPDDGPVRPPLEGAADDLAGADDAIADGPSVATMDPPLAFETAFAEGDRGGVGVLMLASGAAVVALVARTRTRRLWPLLGAFFTRISSDRALGHPMRQRLHTVIGARPGVRYRELAEETGLAHGVLTHHLRLLEKTRHIVARRDAGVTRFYPPGGAPRGPVLDAATEALLGLVRSRGRVRLAEAAATLDCDRRDIARRAERLLGLGLVARQVAGRAVFLTPVVTPRSDVGMPSGASSASVRP